MFMPLKLSLVPISLALLLPTFSLAADTNAPVTLPEVLVTDTNETGGRPGALREEQPIGDNQQPEWTSQRRFATTRIYVLPPWQVEFEQWWKGKYPREEKAEHLLQSEISVGLPYRFQLDVYENVEKPPDGGFRHQGNQVEARWALADWGKIPLNPTLYGEWKFNSHTADAYEVKLLLGDEIAPRWHWGFNLFYEQQVGGGRESEMGFSQALSYSLVDQRLSVGVEMQLERTSEPNLDGKPAVEFLIGPSVQWRPIPRIHLDLVPLFGTTDDSPQVEVFVVFGFSFGSSSAAEINAPASSRSR
jgi:hypothetical protein